MRIYNETKIDEIISNGSLQEKKEIAEQGYGLNKLINDEDSTVREAVAKKRLRS